MSPQWCKICRSYHEPRSSSTCYFKKRSGSGSGTGKFRYPRVGALISAPIYGILATLPLGWLTDGAPESLIVFAVVTPLAAWRMWPKKKAPRPLTHEEQTLIARGIAPQEALSAAEEKKGEGKGALWRWTRRLLLGVAALLAIIGVGFVLYDTDVVRYPGAAEEYAGRYFGRLLDPFGHHEQKTEASLVGSSWMGTVVVEVRDGGGWKEVRRHRASGAAAIDLSRWLPAEHSGAAGPARRARVMHGEAKLRFQARAFHGPIVVESVYIRRASDGRPRYISFHNGSRLFQKTYSKALLEALAKPRKAYVRQRPYGSVEVFVDDETFAKIAGKAAR